MYKRQELTWGNIVTFMYTTLQEHGLFWALIVLVVVVIVLFAGGVRSRDALRRAAPLALAAVLPLLWFAVLRTHSIQHGWFTWRGLGLTLFAGMACWYTASDLRWVLRRLKPKREDL